MLLRHCCWCGRGFRDRFWSMVRRKKRQTHRQTAVKTLATPTTSVGVNNKYWHRYSCWLYVVLYGSGVHRGGLGGSNPHPIEHTLIFHKFQVIVITV